MAEGWPKQRRLLGTKVKRLDGPDKATGRAKYSYDINRPKMAHGVILRSPHAHATIKSLDTTAARKVPGFQAIMLIGVARTGTVAAIEGNRLVVSLPAPKKKEAKDAKDESLSLEVTPAVTLISRNKLVKLADLKVGDPVTVEADQFAVGRELFYAGDEIAAVAADTEEHAKDALRAIKVEYNELDFFVREEDVLKLPNKKTTPGPLPGNFQGGKEATKGDVEAGFKEAEAIAEGTYGASVISHQCLETHGLVAEWDADGGLTVWASTQATVGTAGQLAGRFGVPAAKVKCITHFMGGGFGSKFGPDVQGFTAADLARRIGPGVAVKLMLDREEEVTTAGNRPSARGTVKIGGKKDGTITAFAIDCFGTSGYTGGATVNLGLLPYIYQDAIPNWKRAASVALINAGAARALRAPGHPQNCILTEFAVDDLAAKLGIDPVIIRRKNLPPSDPKVKAKDPIAWAGRRNEVYNEQLDIALKLSGWKEKWHPPGQGKAGTVRHGIGMAVHTWGGFAGGQNEVDVVINRDGSVTAQTSSQDLGTAQRTLNAIVTAEILGLMPTDIIVKLGESQFGPSSGSGGSTTSPAQAPATLLAAQAARDDLFKKVAPAVGADPKDLAIQPGKVVDTKNKKEWAWKEFCARLGMGDARGKGAWSQAISNEAGNENISSGQVGGVQVAEVTVDTETGLVRAKHHVAVQDCGLIVNKLACESQVAGGVIMGINYAMFEENILDRLTGRQVNPDMEFYRLGGLTDMPKITIHMMDMPERGVIGIGEPPTVSTAAAIGNAVFNALGVRVPTLPLTAKRVLDAVAKGGMK